VKAFGANVQKVEGTHGSHFLDLHQVRGTWRCACCAISWEHTSGCAMVSASATPR